MKKLALKFFVVCWLLLNLISCFWFESFDEKNSEKMNTWLAHNESMLYEVWGTPSKSIIYPDGTKILTYIYKYTEKIRDGWWEDKNLPPPPREKHRPHIRPPRNKPAREMAPPSYERKSFGAKKFQIQPLHYRAYSIYHPAVYENYSCRISFTIEKGIITKWSYDGQNAALRRFIKKAPFIAEMREYDKFTY